MSKRNENRPGYKQTHVGWIPISWQFIKIQTAIDRKMLVGHLDGNHGSLYPKEDEFSDDGIPYISANNFSEGYVDFTKCKFLPKDRAATLRKGIALDGDVLFAHNATVGPVVLLKTNHEYVLLSTTATYFRCNDKHLINSYLVYELLSDTFVGQYRPVMAQSTRNQVPITTQRSLSIKIPPLSEQKKIAQILSTWDKAIEQTRKLIEAKKQLKKGLMQQLLSGRMRFPQFGPPAKNGELPDGWKVLKLKDICEFNYGKDWKSVKSDGGKIPVYGTGGLIGLATEYLSKGPSVIIGRKGTIDKPLFISSAFWAVDTTFYTVHKKNINPKYLFYKFSDIQWTKYNEASGVPSLSRPTIQTIKTIVPDVLEQQVIVGFLDGLEKTISQLEAYLEKITAQKKGLMQKLLTGEIRTVNN